MYPNQPTKDPDPSNMCILHPDAIQTYVLKVEVLDKFLIEDRKIIQCQNLLFIDPRIRDVQKWCKEDKSYFIYNNVVQVKNFQKRVPQPFLLRVECKFISIYFHIILSVRSVFKDIYVERRNSI